ncbi:hypothetical protein OGATHE_002607 [Ogataea polymorpha]|uniref:CMP/dCMP-type deaminase domain-containing protein n=1 Tax=Ogataea polymorpha TaxID=460523 RepID=A0A9P8PDQ0_9ASCO|nr:hypothetical protein OGATHE_002607 [Ogataea polymorpha]
MDQGLKIIRRLVFINILIKPHKKFFSQRRMSYDIDYETFTFYKKYRRIQVQDSTEPFLVDHWIVYIEPKESSLINSIIKSEFKESANSLRHLKRFLKAKKNDRDLLKVLICACDQINQEELEKILFGPLKRSRIEKVKAPLNKPFDKELNAEWSAKYWPIVWKGNPMIQELNESYKQFCEQKVHGYLKLISDLSRTSKGLPVVTIFVDPSTDQIMAQKFDLRDSSDIMRHSIMNCIGEIAKNELQRRQARPDPSAPTNYLCLNYHVYTTHEPCTMCAMALLHSRIGRLIYIKDSKRTGAIGVESGNKYMLHLSCSLNWKFESFKYIGDEFDVADIDPQINV